MPLTLLRFARALRAQSTTAEAKMWRLLRSRRLDGKKFRRQHAFAPYVLDFYCHEVRLAIELDGGQHAEETDRDARRSAYLQGNGIRVLRFWNDDVLARTDDVLATIWDALQSPHP